MELQETKPAIKGRFVKGISGNPKGRPKGFAGFKDRTEYLAGKYTWGKCEELCTDRALLRALPVIDAHIVQRLYEGGREGGRNSSNDLLDRVIGKPRESQDINIKHSVQVQGLESELRALSSEEREVIRGMLAKRETKMIDVTPEAAATEHQSD
jgi:hypothetical protein